MRLAFKCKIYTGYTASWQCYRYFEMKRRKSAVTQQAARAGVESTGEVAQKRSHQNALQTRL